MTDTGPKTFATLTTEIASVDLTHDQVAGRGLGPAERRTERGFSAGHPTVAPPCARRRSELARSIGQGAMRELA